MTATTTATKSATTTRTAQPTKETTVTTYDIETLNRADGSVDGHRAGCKDIAKVAKAERLDRSGSMNVATKHDAWLDYNADFLAEDSGAYDINWLPCAHSVPQGAPDTLEQYEVEQMVGYVPDVDYDNGTGTDEDPVEIRMTKAAAWKSVRNLRESVRGLAMALDNNDWDAFEDFYGQVTGDAEMVHQYAEQERNA